MKFKLGDVVFAKHNKNFSGTKKKLIGVHGTIQGYYINNRGKNKYLVKYPLEFVENEGIMLHNGKLKLSSCINCGGKPSNHEDCWYWSEENLMVAPVAHTDLQGDELHLGDSVLIMSNTPGELGKVTKFEGKMVFITLDVSGHTVVELPKNTLIIPANSYLPANVSVNTYSCFPNEINATLWDKGKIVTTASAWCSPSDKFDFFYGLYKIVLPRLFGREG